MSCLHSFLYNPYIPLYNLFMYLYSYICDVTYSWKFEEQPVVLFIVLMCMYKIKLELEKKASI